MLIALVIYGSLDTISGGYLYDRKLVEHLRGAGHRVDIVSLPWRSYREHLTDNFSEELMAKLTAEPYDIILQDELNHPSLAWFNKQLKKRTSAKIISIVHHLRCDEPWGVIRHLVFRQVEKNYLDEIDGFVFNSETTRRSVEKLSPNTRPFVIGLPAGDRFVDIANEIRFDRHMTSGKLKFLFVGNIIERKGLDVLLNALRQVPPNKWELDVVGDETIDPVYVGLCHHMVEKVPRLRTSVRFFGALDSKSLAMRYMMNHVFVLPSRYEGFGIVYLEALGFGLPAIGTTAGAAREIIEDAKSGFVIAPSDPNELGLVLRSLINDRNWVRELSENARLRYEQFPTWEDTCTKVERFLLDMVETP